MKDQNTIPDGETKKDKWNRGLDIFIESVIEPDPALRACAHNQKCYHELMVFVRMFSTISKHCVGTDDRTRQDYATHATEQHLQSSQWNMETHNNRPL